MVEHLRDRSWCETGGDRQLPGGQLAALVELDQQLELGMAELGAAKVRIAPCGGKLCGTITWLKAAVDKAVELGVVDPDRQRGDVHEDRPLGARHDLGA